MNILINTNGVSVGGGLQVADSIIREMVLYTEHFFLIVHHGQLPQTMSAVGNRSNVKDCKYSIPKVSMGMITGRNLYLDNLVEKNHIDAVFTVMGPSKWRPKVPHLEGFARCTAVLPESPYWKNMGKFDSWIQYLKNKLIIYLFRNSSNYFWTESEFISDRIRKFLPDSAKVFTVTSYYNQVYDLPENWDKSIQFPEFDGLTLLTIAANYPHKNLKIVIPLIQYMENKHPDIQFRIVMTINESELLNADEKIKKRIIFVGKVNINQCPFMYEQCDVMFLPSLLECFSACYVEAMRMKKVILVPDLGFAKVICGNSALYYNPDSVESLGEAIYSLAQSKELRMQLIGEGTKQLGKFYDYKVRASKLLNIINEIAT